MTPSGNHLFERSFWMRRRLAGLLLVLGGFMAAPSYAGSDPLEWLERAWGAQEYVPPTASELEQAEEIFFQLMRQRDPASTGLDFAEIGYELHPLGKELFVLAERADSKKGRGLFLFRSGSRLRLGLQAPHARADLHTGRILLKMLLDQPIATGALNTISRNAPIAEQGGVADMAHLDGTFFTAYSSAFARVHPKGRVVQIHGFAPGKRRTDAGRRSEAIVSSGERRPSLDAISIRECLNYRYIDAVSLYPINVFELGGETNTIGNMLRARGFFGFVHLELAPRPRQQLRRNPAARTDFMHCIANGVETFNP